MSRRPSTRRLRWALVVEAVTPASAASTVAGSERPSPSASRIRARAGSAIRAPTLAISASPRIGSSTLTPKRFVVQRSMLARILTYVK